jgi:hypothetical protein
MYFYAMEQHNDFPSLSEWIDTNIKLGISEQESIRTYSEYLVENFDHNDTIEVFSAMIKSLRTIRSEAIELAKRHEDLLRSHEELQLQALDLLRILKEITR